MPKPRNPNMVPDTIRLIAESCEIEAATATGEAPKGPRRIKLVAYTGAKINLDNFEHPVVIDLTGLESPSQKLPIIRDHDGGRIVGNSDKIDITARNVTVEGVASGAGADAAEVLAAHDNGFPWKVSIGAKASAVDFVPKGQTVTVNGRQFSGPIYAVRKARLVEFSLLSLGADDRTSATIAATAAKPKGVRKMDAKLKDFAVESGFDPETLDEKQTATLQLAFDSRRRQQDDDDATTVDSVIEARRANEKRESSIARLAEQFMSDRPGNDDEIEVLARQAVKEKWTAEKTELEMLRATRPKTGAIGFKGRGEEIGNAVIEAAVCRTGGLVSLEKKFDERTLELSRRRFPNGLSICEAMITAAHARGHRAISVQSDYEQVLEIAFPDRRDRDIKAAEGFSTINLPVAFSNVANKFAQEGFSYVEQSWRKIAHIRPVRDFKQISSVRLVQSGQYKKVGPTGELNHGSLGETTYTNQAETYGMMLAIPRPLIVNDDLTILTQVPKELGRVGAQKLVEVAFAEFMDNAAFFTTGNANYASGTSNPDTTLGIDGLTKAEQLFLDQTDENGKPIGIVPRILLVPTALSAKGAVLMRSAEIRNTTASTVYTTDNPHAGKFEVVVSAYLSNITIIGNSTTKWYLLADPADVAVLEIVFLNGVEVPTIQTVEADFDTMGVKTRAFHDFGAKKQEYRGGVAMKGAA